MLFGIFHLLLNQCAKSREVINLAILFGIFHLFFFFFSGGGVRGRGEVVSRIFWLNIIQIKLILYWIYFDFEFLKINNI